MKIDLIKINYSPIFFGKKTIKYFKYSIYTENFYFSFDTHISYDYFTTKLKKL